MMNGGVVSWKSSKHETIADSITEIEYIATPGELRKWFG